MAKKKKVEDAKLVERRFPRRGKRTPCGRTLLRTAQWHRASRLSGVCRWPGNKPQRIHQGRESPRRIGEDGHRLALSQQAIVNRIWGHFMGYGFTKPVDDMGPHNPPTNPELLDRLAADFSGINMPATATT